MTNIQLYGDSAFDFSTFDLADMGAAVSHDDTTASVAMAGDLSLTEIGSGFTHFNSAGFATDGQIGFLQISVAGVPVLEMDSFNGNEPGTLAKILAAGNTKAFDKFMFSGNDTFHAGDGAVTFDGFAGNDIVFGSSQNDTFLGGGGMDLLQGLDGDDVLIGGPGADLLVGGAGADRFVYSKVSDSTHGAMDWIDDLENQDVIDLSAIDANKHMHGNQAFTLVSAFDGHAGELTLSYDFLHHGTWVRGDVNGDGKSDLLIFLSGNHMDYTNFDL